MTKMLNYDDKIPIREDLPKHAPPPFAMPCIAILHTNAEKNARA